MENLNQQIILKYLNQAYYLNENHFYNRLDGLQQWGQDIIDSMVVIFGEDRDYCLTIFKFWAYSFGLSSEVVEVNLKPTILRVLWSQELAHLRTSGPHTDTEQEKLDIFIRDFSDEIGSSLLKDLLKFAPYEELKSLIKCVGYMISPVVCDMFTFRIVHRLVLMNYEHIKHERMNNMYWQDWSKNNCF